MSNFEKLVIERATSAWRHGRALDTIYGVVDGESYVFAALGNWRGTGARTPAVKWEVFWVDEAGLQLFMGYLTQSQVQVLEKRLSALLLAKYKGGLIPEHYDVAALGASRGKRGKRAARGY